MKRFTVAMALVVLSTGALAVEPTVQLSLAVVHASNEGDVLDPPSLSEMKEKFAKSGISYRSYRRLDARNVELGQGKATELKLPNGQQARVTVERVKGKKALVLVSVPPLETRYELGREGSVFLRAGPHEGGVLILVLSPAGTAASAPVSAPAAASDGG
jgi:hypothetical protein